jgi:4-alpha-glucanotransferase
MRLDVKNKMAGLLVPVFALRGHNDLGIGDTTAVASAIEFCSRHNIGVLQVLPINETGGDNSPYNALSSVALDPTLLTVSPDTVPGLTDKDFDSLVTPELLDELKSGPVKYPKQKKLKADLFRKAFANFKKEHLGAKQTDKGKEFLQFRKDNAAWIEEFTLFRTLVDEHDGNTCWPSWKEEFRDYASAVKAASKADVKAKFEEQKTFWAFVQWVAWTQWGEIKALADKKAVALMGDLPFGVSRYSADVWAHPELFDIKWSCGAPPETYFKGDVFVQKWGQNWGMPYYKWEAHEKENYKWWKQRVQYITKLFPYYRIDHVLGFFRVYTFPWIPERNGEFIDLTEAEAKKLTGGDLPHFQPHDDEPEDLAEKNCAGGEKLLKMLMDASGQSGIVAEDLGTVPEYVRPLLKKLVIPGFVIPIFERVSEEDKSFKPKETLSEIGLATYGTHDHMPIARFYEDLVKWWHSPEDGQEGWLEVQRLMKFLGIKTDTPPLELTPELHNVFLTTLLETPCWLTVLMITDLLGTKQRFNEPGMSGEDNWSQRLAKPLEEYEKDPQFGGKIKTFEELIGKTNRTPVAQKKAAAVK